MLFFGRQKINDAVEECRKTAGAVLVDVREDDEFSSGHIPGAVNVPLSRIGSINIPKREGTDGAAGWEINIK